MGRKPVTSDDEDVSFFYKKKKNKELTIYNSQITQNQRERHKTELRKELSENAKKIMSVF